jgi:cyclophilin family peptidyl-prolyl cis-trans isomerase
MPTTPIPDQILPRGASVLGLNLSPYFDLDNITGSLVRLVTNAKGKTNAIFIELFDQLNPADPDALRTTPLTAANFLGYVQRGDYNGAIFHRLAYLKNPATGQDDPSRPFVLQGGGFTAPPEAQGSLGAFPPVALPKVAPVANEPGNPNILGTVAMAKVGGDPNSATNQFFFNLGDNRSILDSQNGGFTAFGRLVGNSLSLLQRWIATVIRANAGGAFSELPLQGYKPAKTGAPPRPLQPANYLSIKQAEVISEFNYRVKAKGARVSLDSTGGLQLQWAKPPTKPVKVSVQAISVINPRETFRSSFVVQPEELLPLAFADPLA